MHLKFLMRLALLCIASAVKQSFFFYEAAIVYAPGNLRQHLSTATLLCEARE